MYALTRNNPRNNSIRTRSNPLSSVDPFALFARDFFGFDTRPSSVQRPPVGAHAPRFDLVESDTAYTLTAEVPGYSESQLEVTFHEGVLAISGSQVVESESEETVENDDRYLLSERSSGAFSRRLQLPKDADADKLSANLEHGILTLSIGKKEELKPRRIPIVDVLKGT